MSIQEKIKSWVKETLEISSEVVLVHPANLENGDFSLIVVEGKGEQYAEALRRAPSNFISQIKFIAPRFINFYLSKNFFADSIKEILESEEDFGKNDLLKGKKFFIEHTQPNPFKEFHIGHLMNNAIGESIVRIVKANGGNVKTATYHGDVGLHVAKATWGMMKKPDFTWGQAYAYGSENYEKNKGEIDDINKKIYEKSDPEINKLYEQGKKESLNYFENLYERLDSNFNFHFYESETGDVGKKIVLENIGKVFEESEGAVVFRGENFEPKTHTRVFLNSDKLPTYEAKEVGLAQIKKNLWPYVCSITVTANEQDAFFDVVEVAIGEIFPELNGKLKHLSHGMLKLPSGKMSSRTGDLITAESLINQVKEKVLEKIVNRGFNDGEKENVAETVAIGAMKYSILRQAIGGDIVFDFDKSISFEGDSGPYLQYTYTRAHSVLEKARVSRVPLADPSGARGTLNAVTDLERYLYRFPENVEKAGREFAPHAIVTYLVELASMFNSFYAKEKIISDTDPASSYKIALTAAVAHIMKNGLYLLGIKTLEKM